MQSSTVMQNLMDSFCQCFGTCTQPTTSRSSTTASSSRGGGRPSSRSSEAAARSSSRGRSFGTPSEQPSTPEDARRRTQSLCLQDKKWDGLFGSTEQQQQQASSSRRSRSNSKKSGRRSPGGNERRRHQDARTPPRSRSQTDPFAMKRKRSRSRDDIFRNKRESQNRCNSFSRFLSNNPVFMNSLCFATPVRGSDENGAADTASSVVSDTNSLNTAEDTITSTLYYEKTKLAGLEQKNPPMPLFDSHAVEPKDEIQKIVHSHSHSSVRLLDMYQQQQQNSQPIILEEEETPPTTPERSREPAVEDGGPPPMTNCSSGSSDKSSP